MNLGCVQVPHLFPASNHDDYSRSVSDRDVARPQGKLWPLPLLKAK
jgi:hypothetical protein